MMPLEIDKDSPLRNFPTNLNPQQGMFLDGIRYSMGMIYIAYNRLAFFLSTITEKIEKKDNSERPSTEALFLDAWVIVDSVYRLRGLIEHMPGIRWCKTAEIKEFLNETTQVEELRHVIQHLRNELKSMTDDLFPVFGNICWIYITDPESEIPIRSCVVSSGKPRQGMVTPNVNVPDKPIRSKIDHIRLSSKKCEVSVTELVLSIKKLQTFIEEILMPQFKNHPKGGADFILILSVGPKLEKV